MILAYLASGRRVNRTRAAAALSELISVGLLAYRDGRYSHSTEGASARECSEVKRSPQRRSGKRGHRAHPRYQALEKVSIIPFNVPDREVHGVTPSLRFVRQGPCLFRFCALRLLRDLVVILGRLSKCYSFFLPACCLWCWLASTDRCAGGCVGYYRKIKRREIIHPPPIAPSPRSVAQARIDSKGCLSRRPSGPGCVLATGGASVGV